MEYQCESLENSGSATQSKLKSSKRKSQIELKNSQIIKGNQEFQEKISLLGKRAIGESELEPEESQELLLNCHFKNKHMKCNEARHNQRLKQSSFSRAEEQPRSKKQPRMRESSFKQD